MNKYNIGFKDFPSKDEHFTIILVRYDVGKILL